MRLSDQLSRSLDLPLLFLANTQDPPPGGLIKNASWTRATQSLFKTSSVEAHVPRPAEPLSAVTVGSKEMQQRKWSGPALKGLRVGAAVQLAGAGTTVKGLWVPGVWEPPSFSFRLQKEGCCQSHSPECALKSCHGECTLSYCPLFYQQSGQWPTISLPSHCDYVQARGTLHCIVPEGNVCFLPFLIVQVICFSI